MRRLAIRPINVLMNLRTLVLLAIIVAAAYVAASAQDNYEIQVYGYDMVAPAHTMVELHSNFTVDGSKG